MNDKELEEQGLRPIESTAPGRVANFLTPRKRAVDLTLAGAGGFLALWAFSLFGPLVIGGYGIYRIFKGQRATGIGLLVFAVTLYGLIKFFTAWILVPKIISLALLIVGLTFFFKPRRNQP